MQASLEYRRNSTGLKKPAHGSQNFQSSHPLLAIVQYFLIACCCFERKVIGEDISGTLDVIIHRNIHAFLFVFS